MNDIELPEPVDFEWDQYNSTKIRLKHDISTKEAEEPFFDYRTIVFDESHSVYEKRYQLTGMSGANRILFIVFTIRGSRIRIISARTANKKERINYGEEIKKNS